jgi:two-component system OmpR family response regulator
MRVSIVVSTEQLLRQLQQQPIDLVILDWLLPSFDSLALVREIRHQYGVPLIILTEQNSSVDRIMGLEAGADDYVGKPFERRELVARIHSVLRRGQEVADVSLVAASSDVVCFDGWELHRDARNLVSPTGLSISLSNAEFRLLTTFLRNPRRLRSRDQLMDEVRGREMEAFERSIDLLVSRLRHKLANGVIESSIIKTVRGAGYMLDVHSVVGRKSRRVNSEFSYQSASQPSSLSATA